MRNASTTELLFLVCAKVCVSNFHAIATTVVHTDPTATIFQGESYERIATQ